MSISAHSNIPSAGLWRPSDGLVHLQSPAPVHHPLCTCEHRATSQSPRRGSGTCLETTSASPWWPAELSQLQNQGHARRGPWFYHNKDFAAAAACEWLQEAFQSIFCRRCELTLSNTVFLSLSCHSIWNEHQGIHPKNPDLCLWRHLTNIF